MKIEKEYITRLAEGMLKRNPMYQQAYAQIKEAVCTFTWPEGATTFTICSKKKSINGVAQIKEPCYDTLVSKYQWSREKQLDYFKLDRKKGGPIDVFKIFRNEDNILRVGLEYETGYIGSGHRSMNKLILGLDAHEIDLAVIVMPMSKLGYYLTDRVTNYEELEPYFAVAERCPFMFFGFNADAYSDDVPHIPKQDEIKAKAIERENQGANKS